MHPHLIVIDAPGGPHPESYWPRLVGRFDLSVGWLRVGAAADQSRRERAFVGARRVVAFDEAGSAEAVTTELLGDGGDGVLALSERVFRYAQAAAWRAGLPANAPRALDALRDKRLQRRMLSEAGLPTPRQVELVDERSCAATAAQLRFPVVLKPAFGMGSVATFLVVRPEHLAARWRDACELLETDSRTAAEPRILVAEELLRGDPGSSAEGLGDFVAVECLTAGGVTHILTVTDKLPLAPPFRENGCIMPSMRDGGERVAISEMVIAAHRALGIVFGVSHTEVKLTPRGPRIIEVNGRPGGGVDEMLQGAAGYDLVGELAKASCGGRPDVRPRFGRFAGDLTLQPPEGISELRSAPTVDRLERDPRVQKVLFAARGGAVLDSAHGTASHFVRLTAVAEQQQSIVELASDVRKQFAFGPSSGPAT